MPSDDPKAPQRQIVIRLPAELLDRVDAHVKCVRSRSPGMLVSHASVIRRALHELLAAAEKTPSTT